MFVAYAAPAAPAVGIGAITGALILVGIAFLATYGAMYGYDYTFGRLLRKIAGWLNPVPFVNVGGAALEAADRLVMRGFGEALDALEASASRLYGGLTFLVTETGEAIVAFGNDVHAAIDGLIHGEIPEQVGAKVGPLAGQLGAVRRALRQEAARLSRSLVLRARALELEIDRTFGRAWRGIDAINTGAIPRIWTRVRDVAGQVADLRRHVFDRVNFRLGRLEKLVLGTALTAAAIRALTRVFPYWQCTNVKRWNRLVCRAPIGALDDLLGLALLTVGSLSIVDFAKAMAPVTEFVTTEVHEWVTED